MLNFFKNLSTTEWIVIALIVIVFFGARFVMGLARTGGSTLREIKKIKKNITESVNDNSENKKEVSN